MKAILDHVASRFLLCGGLAAAINWLARIALSRIMPFEGAILIAYGIGMLAGFLLYRLFVWRDRTVSWRRQVLAFIAVNGVGAIVVLAVAMALLRIGLAVLSNAPAVEAVAHGAAIAVGAIVNFIGHNYLTFRSRDRGVAARRSSTATAR